MRTSPVAGPADARDSGARDAPSAGRLARFLTAAVPDTAGHRWAIHPLALSAAYVVYVFLQVGTTPPAMLRSLLVAVAGTATVMALAWFATRDRHRAAFLTTVVLLVLVGWNSPMLVAAALVLLAAIGLLVRHLIGSGLQWPRVTYIFNVIAWLFVLTLVLRIVTTGALGQIATDLRQGAASPAAASTPRSGGPPDIYLVLFDAYPRGDVLERLFSVDNEPFLAALEERRFEVARNSRSNYSLTELTLASMLNMQLLHDIPEVQPLIEEGGPPQPTLRNLVNDSAVADFLRRRGYEIVVTSAGYEQVAMRHADVFIDSGQINEFEIILLRETGLGRLVETVAPDFLGDQYRARIEAGFRSLRELLTAPSQRPRFVLVHLPTPHAPIVYGRHGEPVRASLERPYNYDSAGQSPGEQIAQFADQLAYINEQTISALDDGLGRRSQDEPIVILWSDHGSRIDFDTDTTLRLEERVSNLFAARTPGRAGLFGETPTTVNVFPTLFEAYFGASHARSPNRLFVSESEAVFDWVEVPAHD